MPLACWRARPCDRELSLWIHISATGKIQSKECFGATPKPARETRALPRLMPLAFLANPELIGSISAPARRRCFNFSSPAASLHEPAPLALNTTHTAAAALRAGVA